MRLICSLSYIACKCNEQFVKLSFARHILSGKLLPHLHRLANLLGRNALTEPYHTMGHKGQLVFKTGHANKVLEVGAFPNHLYRLFVRKFQCLPNYQAAKGHPQGQCLVASPAKMVGILPLQLLPVNGFGQPHPSVAFIQCAAKGLDIIV